MIDQITIVLADDHPVVRQGLRVSLEEDSGLKVVAEVGDGQTAIAAIRELEPVVAVLDLDMPQLNGFGVVRAMQELAVRTRPIILTLHADEDMFRTAMELGIPGYILKDSAMQEIVTGVRAVANGQPYLSSVMTARLLQPTKTKTQEESTFRDRLTPTEARILELIAEGQSSKEIGVQLSIHYRTVENHRTHMCRKLGIEGANALFRYALQNRLGNKD